MLYLLYRNHTNILRTIFLAIVCITLISTNIALGQEKPVLVSVVDEEGKAISGATVKIKYKVNGVSKSDTIDGNTDINGQIDATALNVYIFAIDVSKDGYYSSWILGRGNQQNQAYSVRLKKVKNPVPLYARTVSLDYPKNRNENIGFDFFKGDWVAPHGNGEISDLVFAIVSGDDIDSELKLSKKQHLKVSFPNEGDGIYAYPLDYLPQDSDFQFPYTAPDDGYSRDLFFELDSVGVMLHPGVGSPPAYPFAFSRIRSKRDSDTNRYVGYYLKLYPSIQIPSYFSEFEKIEMTYYLNPNFNDKNLEFSPGENLFSDAPDEPVLDNLNLNKKDSNERMILFTKEVISWQKGTHYRTVDEIRAENLTDASRKPTP